MGWEWDTRIGKAPPHSQYKVTTVKLNKIKITHLVILYFIGVCMSVYNANAV